MHLHLFRFAKGSPSLSRLSLALCFAALVCLAGCSGKKGSKYEVSGKVTTGGKDVGGDIVFVGEDSKETVSPITKGAYVANPPAAGKYKVYFKPMLTIANTPSTGGLKTNMDVKDSPGMEKTSMGVAPPAKYTKVETSGEEVEVSGKQTKDFDLK